MSIYIKILKTVSLMVFFLLLHSCKKMEVVSPLPSVEYFPLETGYYLIYNVDSTWYDDFNLDTTHRSYQMKEYYDTLFTTSEGKLAMRIERSWRNTPSDAWSAPRAYWAYIENSYVVKVIENIPYVTLQFPLKLSTTWNRNRLGWLNEESFKYKKLFYDTLIGVIAYDSVITTQSREAYESIIDKYDFREVYGKNIGLLYQELIDIDSVYRDKVGSDTNNLPIMDKIKKGLVYKATLVDRGFE